MRALFLFLFCSLVSLMVLMSSNISFIPICFFYFFIGYLGVFYLKLEISFLKYFNLFFFQLIFVTLSFVFYKYLNDSLQINSDAGSFFKYSKNYDDILIDGKIIHDGFGAILTWNIFYKLFNYFGFAQENYIGTLFNSILCIWTYGIVQKIFSKIEGFKKSTFELLYFTSPIIIVFYSIHLRDVFIMFLFSIYFLAIYYHSTSKYFSNLFLFIINFFVSALVITLRDEFVFVPSIILIIYYSCRINTIFKLFLFYFGWIIFFVIGFSLISNIVPVDLLFLRFFDNSESKELSIASSTTNSLGVILLYSNIFIRNTLGFIYFLLIPIPFYSGLFTNIFYLNLFSLNSFHAIFCYLLYLFNLFNFLKFNYFYKAINIFIIIFIFFIVNTSFEVRHIAIFFPFIFGFISTLELRNRIKMVSFFIVVIFFFEQLIYIIK
jgi:hypothetical protein